jgi:hypothetical protein
MCNLLYLSCGCASRINVITTPSEADVTVDGAPVGKSPATWTGKSGLPNKSVVVEAKKDGYKDAQKVVERDDLNAGYLVVDGIKYQRLGDEFYYAQELFEHEELTGYLKNMLDVNKSVYEQVVYDSDTEAAFADQLEKNTAIKVYAKLPGWFTVPTPLGSYNPDWAVLVEKDGEERLRLCRIF